MSEMITLEKAKEVRDITGYDLMTCKKLLQQNDGNVDQTIVGFINEKNRYVGLTVTIPYSEYKELKRIEAQFETMPNRDTYIDKYFRKVKLENRQVQYLTWNFTKQQLFDFCLEHSICVDDCHTKQELLQKHANVIFDAIAKHQSEFIFDKIIRSLSV